MTQGRKILAANRGEIAVRIFRTADELEMRTAAVYAYEDRSSGHRQKADEAYQIGRKGEYQPIEAYLQIKEIVDIAIQKKVDLIHPGYGFLAENAAFAKAVQQAGITFVGPSPEVLSKLGDKVAAREAASKCGIPIVPGTDGPVHTLEQARSFIEKHGLPVLVKASFGGGGRGMRVVSDAKLLDNALESAQSEAKAAFGDGTVFMERFLSQPKHIEVQILGDSYGNVVHLFERDCSLQRRHQKVVEIAPAAGLSPSTQAGLFEAALKLGRHVKYESAGTVEFLVEDDKFYFIEMNPRIQVEHTVTEEITGIDIVAAQIQIACGKSLTDIGLLQENIQFRGCAIQCRLTTEIPSQGKYVPLVRYLRDLLTPPVGFRPDTGRLDVCRVATGRGVRLDSSALFPGAVITPYYDSLLGKCTCSGLDMEAARTKSVRALREFRIRGVETNIQFLLKILTSNTFITGEYWTTYIDHDPSLYTIKHTSNRVQKLLDYLGTAAVNGSSVEGQTRPPEINKEVEIGVLKDLATDMEIDTSMPCSSGWRTILLEKGPAAFADAVRRHKPTLITDTTWRDGQQSLLATRIRTRDIEAIATHTSHAYSKAYSLECWGGATFDVALRFLHEDPWERLRKLRALVPNIPFQMLLRSTNGVAYSALPDNAIFHFVKTAKDNGMDIFRVFDGLNNVENLEVGIRAALAAGGVVEGAVLYTGDMMKPGKYNLAYYMDIVDKLVSFGIHIIAFKSMSGVLKPTAGATLVKTIRQKYPSMPIHMHTHDNNGAGVATMMACAEAGADIVDTAIDSLSGTTSQPAMSSVLAALEGTGHDAEFHLCHIQEIDAYWAQIRLLYAGFDADLRSPDPDVYKHEIPGGQFSNLLFQARQLGLGTRWKETKQAYIEANTLLGDIVKATPTSKAVGDLAQFMVDRSLTIDDVRNQAPTLDFPGSVVEFFQGLMGQPFDGFPEPLRSQVLRRRPKMDSRPGLSLPPIDFPALHKKLQTTYPERPIDDYDMASHIMYPDVYAAYRKTIARYGDLSVLPTALFLTAPKLGEEISIKLEEGKDVTIKMIAIAELDKSSGKRDVYFEVNGETRSIAILDQSAMISQTRPKADPNASGDLGAPMRGNVTRIKKHNGEMVDAGDEILTLSAMKMEISVSATQSGEILEVLVVEGDVVEKGDLVAKIG